MNEVQECGFAKLAKLNHERVNADYPTFAGHGVDVWTPMQWSAAMAGELGELGMELLTLLQLCNTIKKLERGLAVDLKDIEALLDRIGEESADIIIYLDLMLKRVDNYALEMGVVRPDYRLREIVAKKFNKTSAKIESEVVWEGE